MSIDDGDIPKAEEDEVAVLAQDICSRLNAEGNREELLSFQRFFLLESSYFSSTLQDALTKAKWPGLFEAVGGKRTLHLASIGRCPCAGLMGFYVWLCESNHSNCAVSCTIVDQSTSQSAWAVRTAIENQGWTIQLRLIDKWANLKEQGSISFDVLLIGHPEEGKAEWMEMLRRVRHGGCVLLLDFTHSSSFDDMSNSNLVESVTSAIDPPEIAVHVSRDKTIQLQPYDSSIGSTTKATTPNQEAESIAVTFVRKSSATCDTLTSMDQGKGSVSNNACTTHHTIASARERRLSNLKDAEWRGEWRKSVESAAIPPELCFSLVDDQPPEGNTVLTQYHAYYKSLESSSELNRCELEGMGRPLLLLLHGNLESEKSTV